MRYRSSNLQINKNKNIEWLSSSEGEQAYQKNVFDIPKSEFIEFEKHICGKIVYPWSRDYDSSRRDFNDVFPAFPKMIVYVRCYNDISYCLSFAQKYKLQASIRSGGHSLAGYSVCDGIIIDMSYFNSVYIDTLNKTALIEAGSKFGDIFMKLEQYSMHIPSGDCPSVGIAGFMQGGGYGLTSRIFGMNCDNVIEVTVMLFNGITVVANQSINEDLFWAIRGGTGGNFGVLLNIKYKLYELNNIYGVRIEWVADTDPMSLINVLLIIQDSYLLEDIHPNLGMEIILMTENGKKKLVFCSTWVGTESDFYVALQPLMNIPYDKLTKINGKYSKVSESLLNHIPNVPDPETVKAYSRSAYIDRLLSKDDWKAIFDFFMTAPNQYATIGMECYGGKINSLPINTNAFIHRNVKMDFFCYTFFNDDTKDQIENEKWIELFFKFIAKYSNGHSYQNYPNRNQDDFRWAYWGEYYDKILQIKQKYDPSNFFKYQQSIGF